MTSQSKGGATLTDKLYFVIGVAGVLLEAIYAALRYPFISTSNSKHTLRLEVAYVILRALHDLGRFSVSQLQWAFPPSTTAYKKWIAANAKAEDVPSEAFTELIGGEGAKLHWVGRKDAKKVILYYHGGGYVLPLLDFHLNFNSYLRREVKRQSGCDVKFAFLEYTYLPKYTYPTQFCQAALALQHILDSGISPADLIISGDSVGGQLALQVLSHILHPYPPLQPIQGPTIPFAGFLVMSPWVIYESNAPTFTHKDKDLLTPHTMSAVGDLIRRGTVLENGTPEPGGYWSEPLKAPPEWWSDTARATRKILITYGSLELFTEDNAALAEKMREGAVGTKVEIKDVEEPDALHIGPLLNVNLASAPNETSEAIAKWVAESLMD